MVRPSIAAIFPAQCEAVGPSSKKVGPTCWLNLAQEMIAGGAGSLQEFNFLHHFLVFGAAKNFRRLFLKICQTAVVRHADEFADLRSLAGEGRDLDSANGFDDGRSLLQRRHKLKPLPGRGQADASKPDHGFSSTRGIALASPVPEARETPHLMHHDIWPSAM